MTDIVQDQTAAPEDTAGPVTMLNRFTAKPGMLDVFIAAQTSEYIRLKGRVAGWRGNRLLRALDGDHAVNVADFESLAAYRAWRDSALFAEHLAVIRPFVEQAAPVLYETVYAASPDGA
jgi:heme-degrading monooxygenase HmoA